MKSHNITIEKIGGRTICLKGIGKMFFQEGYPISIAIKELKEQNVEVSVLHIADECLKNGWSPKTTYNKIKADFEDDIEKTKFDGDMLKEFCYAIYERQREMLFEYLFKDVSPVEWLKEKAA